MLSEKGGVSEDYKDLIRQKSRTIRKLRKNIRLAEIRKRSINEKTREFETLLAEGRVTYSEYEYIKNNYLNGKTEEEWNQYYDEYKKKAQLLISEYQLPPENSLEEKVKPRKANHVLIGILLVLFSLPLFFYLTSYTGFVVADVVEFEYNSSWQNAFVRVSSNTFLQDIPALEILFNNTLIVNLSAMDLNGSSEVFVDLIADGELIDSRRIAYEVAPIVNETNITLPINETFTNETNTNETSTDDSKNKTKKYKLKTKTKDIMLEINGSTEEPIMQVVDEKKIDYTGSNIDFNTDVIAVNETSFESATIYLPKSGNINRIVKCKDWDFANSRCNGSWESTDLAFQQNDTYVWFTVNSFSGYGGAEITVIDIISYPKVGDVWTVRFNTSGKANLTIRGVNNTNWTEFLNDNPNTTNDEIAFESLKCGNSSLNSSMWIESNGMLIKFDALTTADSVIGESIIIPDYECNEISSISNKVLIAGYATLMFQFGEDVAYAFDPPDPEKCGSCSECSALLVNAEQTITFNNNIPITNTTPCLEVKANSTRIHCDGFSISGNGTSNSLGIKIESQSNTTIIDCNITELHYGIYMLNIITTTVIRNNTFDNSTYGVFLDINKTGAISLNKTLFEFNKFYNATNAIYFDNPTNPFIRNNITNNTFLLVKNAISGDSAPNYDETIVRNNTINATGTAYKSGASCCSINRGNITHNFILNNGTLEVDSTDFYCLDVGNYYQTVRSVNARPSHDCGPHPMITFVRVNETAANNATFGMTDSSILVYNHPALALGNINWNGSRNGSANGPLATVQFVSGSRQFNISRATDEIFYVKNISNTNFDCNRATILSNSTSIGFDNFFNVTIGNCTIINASVGIDILFSTDLGGNNNIFKEIYIYNSSTGIRLNDNGGSADSTLFDSIRIRNLSSAGFDVTGSTSAATLLNFTNITTELIPIGIDATGIAQSIFTNSSIFGSTNPINDMVTGEGANRNNVTRNNFSGSTMDTGTTNKFCLDVGNAYLDEASARGSAQNDCGPHPNLREIRVDSSSSSLARFEFGSTDSAKVNYSSLVIAAANAGNDTLIIVVNKTSNAFNGSIKFNYKKNITLNCNNTQISRNGESVSNGIDLTNSDSNNITNCNISGFHNILNGLGTAILFDNTNQTTIDNVTFWIPGDIAIRVPSGAGTTIRNNITNNRFINASTAGIDLGTANVAGIGFWRIEGNYFQNSSGKTLTNKGAIFIAPANNLTVRNNTFFNNSVGIHLGTSGAKSNESVFEFNNFTNNTVGVEFPATGAFGRNNFTNNSFFSQGTAAMRLTSAAMFNYIYNNTFLGSNVTSSNSRSDNRFNDSRLGNHWNEYDTAAEGCDNVAPEDTFCDGSYKVTGSSSEQDYLAFSIESTLITGCTNITTQGTYRLANSISNSGATTCINITISNVTLEGQGYTIDGTDTASTNGVYAFNSTATLNNVTVKNLTLTDWNNGIFYQKAHNGTIDNVNSNSNANYGIYLLNLFGVNITNSIANSNTNYGIFLFSSTVSNRLINNTVNGNNNGIYLWDGSNNNTLINNTVNSNTDFGIILRAASTNNVLFNNTAGSTSYCYYILTANNNNFTNNTARSCTIANFFSTSESRNNKVTNLDIGPIISFDGKDIVILNVSSPSANPSGFRNLGKFINVSNQSADSWLYLNVSYTDSDITNINEEHLMIARHNGSWETRTTLFAQPYGLVAANNYVFANITNFTTGRTFAPLGGNHSPTQGTPVLNSTSGTNTTDENLTVYNISTADIENDPVANIINWYMNYTSILLLNQPFDTNYTNISFANITRDYSGNGLNGTGGKNGNSSQAPRWNNTGVSGGALIFDGLNDAMEFQGMSSRISNVSGAYEFWIMMKANINNSDGTTQGIIDTSSTQTDFELYKENSGENNITFKVIDGSGATHTISYAPVTQGWLKNVWHHVVVTWDTQFGVRIYDNGTLVVTNSSALSTFRKSTGNTLYFGTLGNGINPDTRTMNATFDEFRIYNVSLTTSQVQMNYNLGVARYNRIDKSMLHWNETWQACITPNDKFSDGTTSCSLNLTIRSRNPPNFTEVNATNVTNALINRTGPAQIGQNITINTIVVTAFGSISAVWVRVWRGIEFVSDILFEGFASLINGVYKVNITINISFPIGLVNYTVYVNNTDDNQNNFTSNFTVLSTWAVSDCMNITEQGTYILTRSITGSSATTCINITISNVTFDGNGYTIDGVDTSNTNGVYAFNSTNTLNNVTVKNLVLTDWNNGIFYQKAHNGTIDNVNSNSNANYGIYLLNLFGVNITNSIANSNTNYGIFLFSSTVSNRLINNTVNGNNNGIYLWDSSNNNTLINNTVNSNTDFGIILRAASTNNVLFNNTAGSTSYCYYILTANNNNFTNNTARSCTIANFFSTSESINNKVTNLDIGPIISFDGKDIVILNVSSPSANPSGFSDIGKFINVSNQSADSWLFLNVSYREVDIASVTENRLRISRHNGTWETNASIFANFRGIDLTNNFVFANITNFTTGRTFAPLAGNEIPTQDTPVLNSTFGSNRSNENLTVYNISTSDPNNDAVTNIINWYRNSSSILLLNQPFDTNYTNISFTNITRDYSGNGLNGTGGKNGNSSQAPRWNNTGISGGALIFDGLNDAMEFQGMSSRISNESGTYEFWIMMKADINNSDGVTMGIIDTWSTQTDFELYKENSGENNITFKVIDASSTTHTISYAPLTQGWLKNVWHHVVITWDTKFGVRIYDNGTLVVTNNSALSTFRKIGGNTLYFGSLGNGINPDTRTMNATFDEFRIYNISLTTEQVRANYNRGAVRSDIIEASTTKFLENWQACLTPNDATVDGATNCSNNVTIRNTPPTQGTPVLNSTLGTNRSNENLTIYNISTADDENHQVTNIINWYRNDTTILLVNLPFDTNYTNHSIRKTIREYSNQGYNASIGNGSQGTLPNWTSGCISGGCYSFDSNDTMNLTDTSSRLDFYNSDFSWSFWMKRGVTTTGVVLSKRASGTGAQKHCMTQVTTTILTRCRGTWNNGSEGDEVDTTQTITDPNDNQWHFIVFTLNRVTNLSTMYVDGVAGTSKDITNLGVNLLNTEPLWIGKDGTESNNYIGLLDDIKVWNISLTAAQIQAIYNSRNPNNQIIEASMTQYGENWNASITPNDGLDDGLTLMANNVTINSLPKKVTLGNPVHGTTNLTNRTIIFGWLATTDPDGDAITYNLTVRCYSTLGGSCSPTDDRSVSGITSTSYMLEPELVFLKDDNYYYNWTVTPYDNKDFGEYSNQSNFTLISYVNINLSNDRIDFGSLNIRNNESTTDDSPSPFTIDNIGNVRVEVNLSSTRLFQSAAFPYDNYMFRIRNRTGYPASFNSSSNTSFANVPSATARVIYQFNYTNGTNSGHVDINISVPGDEPEGTKSSILTFIGKYVNG